MPFDVEIKDRVAELVFNHPPVNAFSSAMWLELPELITSLGKNPDVRCVLIRAEGKGFCAGVDIKELAENSGAIVEVNKGNFLTFKAIHECEIPVVSAPHSFVLGGGIGVCGSSDAVIAADNTYFALPEIDRGAMGGASHMQRMFPHAKVRAAFLTGGQITAEEAHRLGGIEQVVSTGEHLGAAREFAGIIASKSRDALRIAKQALNGIESFDVDRNYRWEQGFTFEMYMHEDSQSARDAFVETGKTAKFEDT
ncbi:MAG: enoyl-CoA hydratase family protein [Gammaproteobacteria bacterium]|jgi:enoyl-CoA hydratase|nr:enoyl-CoA hydratase family protein [Gammaproteobacteria bacterium]MBT3867254.1 enoyl-CoA hydratase family protein [Gammaproteobacteria bacterium]MBT4381596.1 enoyl-CoA hydratase family protein [Gammaproteobacteria bacterium]MBT4615250.1 enoyl-CoA hydratase family protein [Gammaproteobacteria bacterium]MBT5196575.1 enoyl-CoA hydratase family protein [Gammaproteobacteria bacterium]